MAKKNTIQIDTPVDEVLNDRPALIRLAQVVFDRTTARYLRAFSRFRKSSDLAALIQAARDEVFDYGACIVDTDTDVKFPGTEETLEALALAIDGELTPSHMESLGLTAEDFGKVCPGAAGDAKPAAKKAPAKAAVPKTKAAPKVEKKVEEKKGEVVHLRKDQGDVPPPAATVDLSGVLERIDQLSSDIGTVLSGADAKFEGKVTEIQGEIAGLRAGLIGVVGLFDVIAGRLDVVGKYFVDEYIEWPEVPDEVQAALESLGGVTMVLVDNGEDEEDLPPEVDDSSDDEEVEEKKPAPMSKAKKSDDDSEIVEYDEEYLDGLELPELRDIADSLGIPRAQKIGYKKVAIKKILKAQAA